MKKVLGGVVLFGVLVCAAIAESITLPYEAEAKVPPVVTLIQREPDYFENTEIVGSENDFNIEKFTNPTLRSGGDVQTTSTDNKKEENGTSSSGVPAAESRIEIHMHECATATERLTKSKGIHYGVSGKESYYNLPMGGVVQIMRSLGYSEQEYPYWVCEGCGCKMLGKYIMAASNFDIRPRGTIIETSLGLAICADAGAFAKKNPTQLDVAVDW